MTAMLLSPADQAAFARRRVVANVVGASKSRPSSI